MARIPRYRLTSFDHRGPEAALRLRTFAYGGMVATLSAMVLVIAVGPTWWVLPAALLLGAAASAVVFTAAEAAGRVYHRLMVSGESTPYKDQYSDLDALVMRGDLDAALARAEAIAASEPRNVAVRIRAAEWYALNKKDAVRAAELFHEIQVVPDVPPGDDVYASQRLSDLYAGPLGKPGRAMVELRRLIDRYPASRAAASARSALAQLKLEQPS
jgi:hypothetical protein